MKIKPVGQMIKRGSLSCTSIAFLIGTIGIYDAQATPAFARKEKKACAYCHTSARGGGKRGFRGMYYQHHELSFKGFVEKKEAKLAGVKPGAMAEASIPTKPYEVKH